METFSNSGFNKSNYKPSKPKADLNPILTHLFCTPQLGSQSIFKLLQHFDAIEDIPLGSEKDWKQAGLGPKLYMAFHSRQASKNSEGELELQNHHRLKPLYFWEPEFPKNLLNSPYCPLFLYHLGGFKAQDSLGMGVVGTRTPTHYGYENTQWLCKSLCDFEVPIISGLAMGIDRIAHKTAIENQNRTLAVLGHGLFSSKNAPLLDWIEKISQNGVVLSHFRLTEPASRGTFPARNKIISGLSKGIILPESRRKGGAMITAKQALEEGKELFCLLGPIHSECSTGPNLFASQGAQCIISQEDFKKSLSTFYQRNLVHSKPSTKSRPPLSKSEQLILKEIQLGYPYIDQITQNTGLNPIEILKSLTSLEFKKCIKQQPGGSYAMNNYIL